MSIRIPRSLVASNASNLNVYERDYSDDLWRFQG